MGAVLNLFTLLVFLLVLVAFYTVRALSRRQRRADAIDARLALLRDQLADEASATPSPLPAAGDDSILLAVDGDLLPAWPWLNTRLNLLRMTLRMVDWHQRLRRRVCIIVALAVLGALFIARMTPQPMLVVLLGTPLLAAAIFTLGLQSAITKHLAELGRSLPEAIDAITRVCRAGVPLHSAFAIAGDTLHGALSREFSQIDHWLKLGVPIRVVMQDSARRVPLAEYRFFSVILIISQESGGRLGDTLERLSATLRARTELKMKVSAKTSEARASTKIVAMLVPGVLAYMYFNAPQDFRFMLSDPVGVKVMAYAAVSIGLGLFLTHMMVRRIS